MNKPNNYDNTRSGGGEFEPIELGGHRGIIKQVEETTSKTGKPMAVVYIDFAPEDKQPRYLKTSTKTTPEPRKSGPSRRRSTSSRRTRKETRAGASKDSAQPTRTATARRYSGETDRSGRHSLRTAGSAWSSAK